MRRPGYYGNNRQLSLPERTRLKDWQTFYTEESEVKAALEFYQLVKLWKRKPGMLEKQMLAMPLGLRRTKIEQLWFGMNYESSRDFEFFASFCRTKDEHGQGTATIKPFPTREEKSYLWDIADTFQKYKAVAVEKSRQLLLTWLCCLYCLWVAKYRLNQLIFVQSKKEEDAANLVYNTEPNHARISFIESHLPAELQSAVTWTFGKAFFSASGSRIWGVPEGGDQIRSYTPSLVFSDEFAFQPEAELAWKAMLPALVGGGQVILVSSAKNGAFMKQLLQPDTRAA